MINMSVNFSFWYFHVFSAFLGRNVIFKQTTLMTRLVKFMNAQCESMISIWGLRRHRNATNGLCNSEPTLDPPIMFMQLQATLFVFAPPTSVLLTHGFMRNCHVVHCPHQKELSDWIARFGRQTVSVAKFCVLFEKTLAKHIQPELLTSISLIGFSRTKVHQHNPLSPSQALCTVKNPKPSPHSNWCHNQSCQCQIW